MNKRERVRYREDRMEELQATVNISYEEIRELRAEEATERNAKSIGKCYRYRNSHYGDSSWWYYMQVTGVDEEGHIMGWGFERDLDDEISIYLRFDHLRGLGDSYDEIPSEQFWTEWQNLKSELDMLATINCDLKGDRI